jgi:hypothetical protein
VVARSPEPAFAQVRNRVDQIQTWADPAQVSPTPISGLGRSSEQPQIAIDAAGDAVAIWEVAGGGLFTHHPNLSV